ncbi:hypothetical protein SAMN05518801_10688 [Novosphingobium sp. CF614]|uniref:hypothetical protein n=1 Tax=Novosphingobium sp. CF614 TaxID=1884364 RepID=UPI0008EF1407|nr:hypothetical protein [Novosphingobium sp. CF614]SFG04471.1 hypothetical protein SAMN05518801_10688 [Novosphingobium sp. CF614]
MQTERVTFLTTPAQKAALDAYAAGSGKSVGHVLREASMRYLAEGDVAEEEQLALLVQELGEALPKIHDCLDRTIRKLDETHRELERMRREAGFPK